MAVLFIVIAVLVQIIIFSSQPPSTAADSSLKNPRKIAKHILSIEQGEGDGARVRRSIGTPQIPNLDPFLMLDEAFIPNSAGFP
jgi:hypothetical protein